MQVPIELKIRYLSRRLEDMVKLRSMLEEEDYSYAFKVGHQIKGNAVTFEIPQIASLGVELEKAALRKDKERIKLLAQKMEHMINTERSFF